MALANTIWQIAFGDYDFAIDRKTLTYRLTETQTGTVWADGLSVGWLELENSVTGERIRHDFGTMRIVSLSEKSGPQGKRILFGLDCQGVPVDINFTCSQREIQLTVEASRDTREYRVGEVCLLPGLASVPDDGASYLVLPHRAGLRVPAAFVPASGIAMPIWDSSNGVTMPFIGAVRRAPRTEEPTALTLITDSVYAAFHLTRMVDGAAVVSTHYQRDPERRRLDVRLVLTPKGEHIASALAYRSKIVAERNHITLRKKLRENPALEWLIRGCLVRVNFTPGAVQYATLADALHRQGLDRFVVAGVDIFRTHFPATGGISRLPADETKWDTMDKALTTLGEAHAQHSLVGIEDLADWATVTIDCWPEINQLPEPVLNGEEVPLLAAVYHDSVVLPGAITENRTDLLRCLLYLAAPSLYVRAPEYPISAPEIRAVSVLAPMYEVCFSAFLTEHRFLTPDFLVEEARYSNSAYILINQSRTADYQNERVTLPPGGFYVEHPQMIAHDAWRVGSETFNTRAFRITRSRDGKPLHDSADVLQQEFPAEASR